MLYGLYQSSHGANVQAKAMEVVTNNLANVETTSFKRDIPVFQVRPLTENQRLGKFPNPPELQNHAGIGALADVATSFANGHLERTGGSLDVALQGPGFFQVQTPGGPLLTRAGKLGLGPGRQLVEANTGHPLLTPSGQPISVPGEVLTVEFSTSGAVYGRLPDGSVNQLGQLNVVMPADVHELQKEGDSLYRPAGPLQPAPADTQVLQGYVESSTVEPVREMLSMIQTSRAFETNLNMLQYQDQSLGQLLQAVGK